MSVAGKPTMSRRWGQQARATEKHERRWIPVCILLFVVGLITVLIITSM